MDDLWNGPDNSRKCGSYKTCRLRNLCIYIFVDTREVRLSWTWDPDKAASNLRKHGVSFELAERVLGDPFAVTLPDPCEDEERWRTIGMPTASGSMVLLVVHTVWDEDFSGGRIISARRALTHERTAYEEGQF